MEIQNNDFDIDKFLHKFCCVKDSDIENFLYNKAVQFEKLFKSRTYFVVPEEDLQEKDIMNVSICGYFAVAIKILTVSDNLSNHFRKDLDGFNAKLHRDAINDFPCYLIGQLAKNSNFSNVEFSGTDLLNYAFGVIDTANEAVGGRFILVESKPNCNLFRFYTENGFRQIAEIADEGEPMVQLIRMI